MKTSFHAILAVKAGYHATMLVEPLLGRKMDVESINILVRNMSSGYLERTMPVVDELVRTMAPIGTFRTGYSYDQVMTEATKEELTRSAGRAAMAVGAGEVIEGENEAKLLAAIATELTYLWLRSCEKFYESAAKAQKA